MLTSQKSPSLRANLIWRLRCELESKGIELESHYCFDDLIPDIPRRWTIHGDLILLPHTCFTSTVWCNYLGPELWDIVAQVFQKSRVARNGSIQKDKHRTPSVTLLKGQDGWVEHVDNNIRYRFDVTKNMFCRGNITEKLRVAKFDCSDEIVVDMFAGIGYFTLPFLIHAKAKHVHAIDCNPDSVEALKVNLNINKVSEDRYTVYHGDCNDVAPKNVADRVYLGLIPSSYVGWKAACTALNREMGGTIHIHENVTTRTDNSKTGRGKKLEKDGLRRKYAGTVRDDVHRIFIKQYGETWNVDVSHVEFVKQYAPHVDHIIIDLSCRPFKN
ncbi:TRMT12 (predicted) [Pycnogonum litorale]